MMKHIIVYTKPTTTEGQYKLAALDTTTITVDNNAFYHVMQVLRLKGSPEAAKHNFAYTFGFNFGGQR